MLSVQIHQTCLCECPHVVCIDVNMPHGSVRAEVSRVCTNCIFALWWQVSSCRHVAGTERASVVIVKNVIIKKNSYATFLQLLKCHFNFHSLVLFMHVSPPLMFQSVDVVWWRLLLPGGCVPVFVCLCVCVCMPVFVWPCVPLLSAVILPASGFDKDKQCGGKWMNSWPHFVSVRLAQFYLARHTLHLHPMCLMSILGPRKTLNSRNETERTRGRTSKPKTFFFFQPLAADVECRNSSLDRKELRGWNWGERGMVCRCKAEQPSSQSRSSCFAEE